MAPFSTRDELKSLAGLAAPILCSNLALFGMSLTVLISAGHLGSAQLTAVAYSQMLFDITILVFTYGFVAGQAALSAQAYGAGNLPLVGRYCQMTCVIVSLACVPIGALWWFTGDLLFAGGVSATTAAHATAYAHYAMPGLLPRLLFHVLSIYFKSMQNVIPAAVLAVTFAILNVGLVPLLVFGAPSIGFQGYGLVGAPIAYVICQYARTSAYVIYMFGYKKHHATSWQWSTKFLDAKLYLMPMVRVGGPLALGMLVEDMQLQTMAIFAGMTSEVALGANNSMLELIMFLTSPLLGLLDAATTRIGMHLGAGDAHAAKATSHLVLYSILSVCAVIVVPWLCARSAIGHLFSSDASVVESMTNITTLAAAGYILMSFFYYAMATLEAQARTVPIMTSFLVGAWVIGVPLAYVLDFNAGYGLLGIWIGMSAGYATTTFFGVYFTYKSDWPEEAKKAVARSTEKDDSATSIESGRAPETGYEAVLETPSKEAATRDHIA
ncbi:hypothetical protein SDRG_05584 [Saprolegnia diclina VS20]|uniref:MATE efflux family protein n=1 Tax=Saprolegnia diclina (strain VS20) TaxID=1156394 RepID=T0S3M8_SAPDV|nr:hypothetical protein SDRG_05584 [Saprolegnia diclina VS20]EQC37367.1 hypothetical protein SDRG_05584 [Saprolegnia diclina VS20]|eukprot:XP_008609529.1 hypothetical protein SDRG_05584 [Saprolegnia diclina VS20]